MTPRNLSGSEGNSIIAAGTGAVITALAGRGGAVYAAIHRIAFRGARSPGPTSEYSALDSAIGALVDAPPVDVTALDLVAIAAPKPEETGEPREAQQTLVEAVVVLRVCRRVADVLRRDPCRGAGAREADQKE